MDRRLLLAAALTGPALAVSPATASAHKKKGGGATFLQMQTLTASIVRPDGRRGVMTVEAGVDAKEPSAYERALAYQPRLRDAYNATLARFAAGMRPGIAPDLDLLVRDLQTATDCAYGKPGLKLLLGSVIIN